MKKFFNLGGLALAAILAAPVQASGIDGDAVVGGALGGAAGAAVGSAIGGRDGAIIGGALGGATGTAVMTNHRRERVVVKKEREVVYVRDDHEHHDRGRHLGHHKHKHKKHRHEHDD